MSEPDPSNAPGLSTTAAAGAPAAGLFDESVYQVLFGAYPDGLLLVDGAGRIVLANPAVEQLLDYPPGTLVGKSVEDLVPDAVRPRHATYRGAYARQPRVRPMGTQMDLVARKRLGGEVAVEIALSPLHTSGFPYVVAAIRGIEAYPRVTRALQQARYADYLARFGQAAVNADNAQALLGQLPAIAAEALQIDTATILLIDPDSSQLHIAAGVGLTDEDKVGDLIPDEAGSAFEHLLVSGQPVQSVDEPSQAQFRISPHDVRTGMLSKLAVPLADRNRTIGILEVRSRTRRSFGEDEIRFLVSLSSLMATVLQREQSEQALHHSQRLEAVGQLTGGIAHDFNNLLTVISGNLQMIEETPAFEQDSLVRQSTNAALRAARRSAELTSKLLAFSRRQVLQPAVVDMQSLLRSFTDMLRRTLDQRIVISVDTEALSCLVDPVQLESALLNIAINARDAMPDGGRLAFTGRAVRTIPSDVRDQAEAPMPGGYASISISDTGIGMSEAVKARALEPFFTTKGLGRGTGLGLSTVYGFVRQSHGVLRLASAPGEGTTITMFLPRVAPSTDHPPPPTPTGTAIEPGLRVLLVEDDAQVSATTERFLVSMGCTVTACADAQQALAALGRRRRFDLMLTDIALGPGMRGTALATEVRRRRPALPVVLMSGFTSEVSDAPPGLELLLKPYSRDDLERTLARALQSAKRIRP